MSVMESREKKNIMIWFFLIAGVIGIVLVCVGAINPPKNEIMYWSVSGTLWLPVSFGLALVANKL